MIIPRVLSRGNSAAAQRAHFADILTAAVDLPSVIYNSPYYGYETKADLFFELRSRFPHLIGFKEFGGAADMTYCATFDEVFHATASGSASGTPRTAKRACSRAPTR